MSVGFKCRIWFKPYSEIFVSETSIASRIYTSIAKMEILSKVKTHGGVLQRIRHQSTSTGTPMTFAVFLPSETEEACSFGVLMYLSGLTCTDENVSQKGNAFESCAKHRVSYSYPSLLFIFILMH